MPYTKTTWENDQPPAITADALNNLETQYDEAMADVPGVIDAAFDDDESVAVAKVREVAADAVEQQFAAQPPAGEVAPDLVNSWWMYPDAVINNRTQTVHVSGSTSGGTVRDVWFDLINKTTGSAVLSHGVSLEPDDHNGRAILMRSGKPVVTLGAFHGDDEYIRVVRSYTPGEMYQLREEQLLDMTSYGGAPAYGTLIGPRAGTGNENTLAGMFRSPGGNSPNYVIRSTDYGATWGAPLRLVNRPYVLFRRQSDNTDAHFLFITHPTQGTVQCHYGRLKMGGGGIETAAGISALHATYSSGNIWTSTQAGTDPLVDISKTDLVRQPTGSESQRVLDMTHNGRRIVMCVYPDKNDMSAGGEYRVYVRQTNSSTNSWSEEALTTSGAAYYPASGYVGGACFASDGSVILAREEDGAWTLERWIRTSGGTFTPGTWELDRVLYTAPDHVVGLGRPRSIIDCDDWTLQAGLVTFGEYYNYADFNSLNGSQRILRY